MALPTSELRNRGKGLSDSGLEREGEPTSGRPVLFPICCSGQTLGDWRSLESRSGGTEAEQTGSQEPHPRWADSMRKDILTLEGGPEGGKAGLDLRESQAFEELSLGALDKCERQVSEG